MSLEHSPAKQKQLARQYLTANDLKALIKQPIQPRSFTITQWCAMRGYSRVYFYVLRREGNAPDVIGEGKAQRITDEADARWVKKQERKAKRARS